MTEESPYRASAAPRKPVGHFSLGGQIWFFWESVESLRVVKHDYRDTRLLVKTKCGHVEAFVYEKEADATAILQDLLRLRQEWFEHLARLSAGSRIPE